MIDVSYHETDERTYSSSPNYLVHSLRYENDPNGLVLVQHIDGFAKYGAGISLLRHHQERQKGGHHDCCCLFAAKQPAVRYRGIDLGFAGFRVRAARRKKREKITEIRRYELNQIFSIPEFIRMPTSPDKFS